MRADLAKWLLPAALVVATGLLSPVSAKTIAERLAEDGRFSRLLTAMQEAGLSQKLSGPGPLTVYAPTDAAFETVPPFVMELLLQSQNRARLSEIVLYHLDDRRLGRHDFPHGSHYFKPLLDAHRLCITLTEAGLTIADGSGEEARVVTADIEASNGVIHAIDKVLLPDARPDCH